MVAYPGCDEVYGAYVEFQDLFLNAAEVLLLHLSGQFFPIAQPFANYLGNGNAAALYQQCGIVPVVFSLIVEGRDLFRFFHLLLGFPIGKPRFQLAVVHMRFVFLE